MKTTLRSTLLVLALPALLLLTPGCQTTPPPPPTPAQLATWQAVAEEVADIGVTWDLLENPAHRPKYVVSLAALQTLLRTGNHSPEGLMTALAGLPVLRGKNGALIEGGAVLFIVASGAFVHLDQAPVVEAITTGLVNGLDRALHAPRPRATLPARCVVPARP
jgi:hypothetical protein